MIMAKGNGKTQAPPVEMVMSPEEFAELRAAVAAIGQTDVQLGRVLDMLVLHLAHAHDLDPTVEDARLKAEALKTSREEEDARLEAEAEALKEKRASEDAQPREPLQLEALKEARAAEDVQITADAEALAKAREEEDAQASEKDAQAEAPAPVEAPAKEGKDNGS
jgi:hypothetical protein